MYLWVEGGVNMFLWITIQIYTVDGKNKSENRA
jgi:hypothetical protein